MYVPDRGHLVYVNFSPQTGHEQLGIRPAIVLSPKSFNHTTGFALVCPITRKQKGYPFEVKLPTRLGVEGVILTDQIKSLDWKARQFSYKGIAANDVVDDCLQLINTILNYK